MTIRQAVPEDRERLLDIWLRSVRATHTFLSEADIQSLLPIVKDIALVQLDVWVLCTDSGEIMGFMGMADNKMEALFLAPEYHRQGAGRKMVAFARDRWGETIVDVNEQNPAACRFYESCGFLREGRSELDSNGLPFPLLHLRLPASSTHADIRPISVDR